MSKKTLVWVGIVAVVVVVGVIAYYFATGTPIPQSGMAGGQANGTSSAQGGGMASSTTAQPLPSGGANLVVPSENATSVPQGVAAPTVVASGSISGTTSFRSFNVTETATAFTPATIIVNQGDTVHINLTAEGGAYDFTQPDLGLKLALKSGQTKLVQFDAVSSGKFTFYCSSCGGPAKGPVGYIEVVAK